jgi:hypothetical protein
MSAVPPLASIPVGVIVERRKATNPWVDYTWRAASVLPGEPTAAPWTALSTHDDATTFYAGAAHIDLFRSETTNYRDNLIGDTPSLWVKLRPTGVDDPPFELMAVTADPAEGEAFTEAGNDLIEVVAMPEAVREVVAAFVAEHHVEREFFKRQRDRADPEALGRRGPLRESDEE